MNDTEQDYITDAIVAVAGAMLAIAKPDRKAALVCCEKALDVLNAAKIPEQPDVPTKISEIDGKALARTQHKFAEVYDQKRNISIRKIIEFYHAIASYEDAKEPQQPDELPVAWMVVYAINPKVQDETLFLKEEEARHYHREIIENGWERCDIFPLYFSSPKRESGDDESFLLMNMIFYFRAHGKYAAINAVLRYLVEDPQASEINVMTGLRTTWKYAKVFKAYPELLAKAKVMFGDDPKGPLQGLLSIEDQS